MPKGGTTTGKDPNNENADNGTVLYVNEPPFIDDVGTSCPDCKGE
ncbi:MAG: hypothetical protein RhofKO_32170 [Rhodothermales bacterium]